MHTNTTIQEERETTSQNLIYSLQTNHSQPSSWFQVSKHHVESNKIMDKGKTNCKKLNIPERKHEGT